MQSSRPSGSPGSSASASLATSRAVACRPRRLRLCAARADAVQTADRDQKNTVPFPTQTATDLHVKDSKREGRAG